MYDLKIIRPHLCIDANEFNARHIHFTAPAQAFALTLNLHERGVFTWPEWTAALAEEIRRAQSAGDPDTGDTYYHHWVAALEEIVVAKGLTTFAMLTRYRDAWDAAARRTPHGTPIELGPHSFPP